MKKVRRTSATPAKKRRGPGVPFKKGDDKRRWKAKPIDPERRQAEKDFRQYLLEIAREVITGTDERGKALAAEKLEMLARVYWGKALAGEIDFGNAILDRMFGKPTQPISGGLDLNMSLSMDALTKSYREYQNASD